MKLIILSDLCIKTWEIQIKSIPDKLTGVRKYTPEEFGVYFLYCFPSQTEPQTNDLLTITSTLILRFILIPKPTVNLPVADLVLTYAELLLFAKELVIFAARLA